MIVSEEINDLINKKNILETEIIQRNTKLVNGFIRQKYGSLLVETDELFQICYIAMWEAVKVFDYKKGNKFSTLAYKYMDQSVKHSFKELTGYSWDDYWTKKKIKILLENTSDLLGRPVNVEELIEYGILAISEIKAKTYLGIMEKHSLSDLYSVQENSYEEYEIDSQYATYFGDDEIDDYENGMVEEIILNGDKEVFKNILREEIENVLSTLTEKEKIVLKLRFGLDDGKQRTLEEVGKVFAVQRERIRQIEAKALRKLRHPRRSNRLKGFLEDYLVDDRGVVRK